MAASRFSWGSGVPTNPPKFPRMGRSRLAPGRYSRKEENDVGQWEGANEEKTGKNGGKAFMNGTNLGQ